MINWGASEHHACACFLVTLYVTILRVNVRVENVDVFFGYVRLSVDALTLEGLSIDVFLGYVRMSVDALTLEGSSIDVFTFYVGMFYVGGFIDRRVFGLEGSSIDVFTFYDDG